MWKFEERYAVQDKLEFMMIAEAMGWTEDHSQKLSAYAKRNPPNGTELDEQSYQCHLHGYLPPFDQRKESIERWLNLLDKVPTPS